MSMTKYGSENIPVHQLWRDKSIRIENWNILSINYQHPTESNQSYQNIHRSNEYTKISN